MASRRLQRDKVRTTKHKVAQPSGFVYQTAHMFAFAGFLEAERRSGVGLSVPGQIAAVVPCVAIIRNMLGSALRSALATRPPIWTLWAGHTTPRGTAGAGASRQQPNSSGTQRR